jgi:hypothetical protein
MLPSKTYREVIEHLNRTIKLLPPLDVNENDFELQLKLQRVLKLVLKQEDKAGRAERAKALRRLFAMKKLPAKIKIEADLTDAQTLVLKKAVEELIADSFQDVLSKKQASKRN